MKNTEDVVAGSLHPVVSRMVAGFKVSVVKCWRCGFSPVQLRTLAGSGRDEFCFTCPNEDCEDYWRSPQNEMWQPTKATAAEKWNAANEKLRHSAPAETERMKP